MARKQVYFSRVRISLEFDKLYIVDRRISTVLAIVRPNGLGDYVGVGVETGIAAFVCERADGGILAQVPPHEVLKGEPVFLPVRNSRR